MMRNNALSNSTRMVRTNPPGADCSATDTKDPLMIEDADTHETGRESPNYADRLYEPNHCRVLLTVTCAHWSVRGALTWIPCAEPTVSTDCMSSEYHDIHNCYVMDH